MINNISDNINERVADHLLWLSNSQNYSQKFSELAVSEQCIFEAEELWKYVYQILS